MSFLNRKEQQKTNRSAEANQIFINSATGKTYFIKQESNKVFMINGERYEKKPTVITIKRKVEQKQKIKEEFKGLINDIGKIISKKGK